MSAPAAVEAARLSVGYGREVVVAGIELELAPGQELAVVGTNGSGKSTLVRTLAGLQPPLAGTVRVLGAAPGRQPARVAYLRQFHSSSFVLPLRAIDVVTMGRFAARGLLGRMGRADRRAVRRAMERMDVVDLATLPVGTLSGGQRQRVHLAQALAWEADLLILDEPSAGLDVAAQERLDAVIDEERARGAAVVTCTHDIRDAMRADRALLLAGRVVAAGPPDQVLTREALAATFGLVIADLPDGIHMAMDPSHGHDHAH